MTDSVLTDFRALLDVAARFRDQGAPAAKTIQLACAWSRDPGTGRMECHWVTEPPRH
jgi:hypothetical protein